MPGLFYSLGQWIGPELRKASWLFQSLTGSEKEAIAAERAVGRDFAREFLERLPIHPDDESERFVNRMAEHLARSLSNPHWRFEVRIVQFPAVNAFALPGGFLFLTRPLLDFCDQTGDELAFVVGHEIGHIIKGHAMERMMANAVIGSALARVTSVAGLARLPLSDLTSLLLQQSYSRDQEHEADRFGVQLAAAAGYDGHAALRLLSRLTPPDEEPPGLVGYFASHPPREERLREIGRALRCRGNAP
jgi:predicted Zn-dependent protease